MEPSASQPSPNPNPEPSAPPAPEPAPAAPPRFSRATIVRILIISIIAVSMLVVGALVYLLFLGRANSAQGGDAVSLSTLASISFVPPESLTGYSERSTGLANTKHYVSDDGNCELLFGILPAMQLPGKDLEGIMKPQIDQLHQADTTVDGPKDGTQLTLKDAASAARYSLPTRTYSFSQGNKYAAVHYSAAILQTGERAVVSRSCVNTDQPVDAARMDSLNAKAKEIFVLKQ